MPYDAKILADSLAPCSKRLTTFEISIPKFLLAELNTHRLLSKNAASSRAIPIRKMIEMIKADPVEPVFWGKNQPGMQATEELDEYDRDLAIFYWHQARDMAVSNAMNMDNLGVSKQIVNRLLESYCFAKVIVSGTEWANFFRLRTHKDAQPEFQFVAKMMQELYLNNTPTPLAAGDWHLPLIFDEDRKAALDMAVSQTGCEKPSSSMILDILKRVSVGRCCRVSYLTHDGKRDLKKDLELADKLISGLASGEPPHLSPYEHVAMAMENADFYSGNYAGFKQFRKEIVSSNCF